MLIPPLSTHPHVDGELGDFFCIIHKTVVVVHNFRHMVELAKTTSD